jgi:hypothetical protein
MSRIHWVDECRRSDERLKTKKKIKKNLKTVRKTVKLRRNTYVLFNLERSHDSIFIENREVVL